MDKTCVAIVGCGYVADYYMATRNSYPNIQFVGAYDEKAERTEGFCEYHGLFAYSNYEELLSDEKVDIVLNLTNPRSHYKVSKQALEAGKNVYSEKPLAMEVAQAEELVAFAKEVGLQILSAPCSVLGKAAKTLSRAVKSEKYGKPRLVYAELDDGMVHQMPYETWLSESGTPWPYKDEFEVGCTIEHVGYVLTWFIEMFGSVKSVVSYSDCLVEDKLTTEELTPSNTPDASFAVLKFSSGVVVRLTTTIFASHDHTLRVFCDKGVLYMNDSWNNNEPVKFKHFLKIRRKGFISPIPLPVKYKEIPKNNAMDKGNTRMDFLLGVDLLSRIIRTGENTSFFNMDFCLQVNTITHMINSGKVFTSEEYYD